MTISEAMNFHEQDEEKYNLSKNTEFLTFLENAKNSGYKCYISIDKLQEMVNFLVTWFELKYPERMMREEDGIYSANYSDIESITEYMTPLQLLYRLPNDQECLMKCHYRSHGAACTPVYDETEKRMIYKNKTYMTVKRLDQKNENIFDMQGIDPYTYIAVDPGSGKVDLDFDFSLAEIINDKGNNSPILIDLNNPTIKLETLLDYLKNNKNLDLSEVEECVLNHKMDLLLRDEILRLTTLALLYSRKTIPEYGYRRAKRFITEINKDFGTNLTFDEIDEIMKRDYKKKKEAKERSASKNKGSDSGIKKLIKSIWHN